MQVNPEDGPPEIYVTWSDPRMTDFENDYKRGGTAGNYKINKEFFSILFNFCI